MAEGERISPLTFIMGWLGAARRSTSRLFTRVETAGRESMEAGQAESLPAAVCIDAPLTSCMAWHPGIIDTLPFFFLHQSHFPFPRSWLMVAQAAPEQWRELPRSCLTAPPASIKPVCPPRRLCFPRFPTLDITFPRKTTQYLVGFIHSPATLDWRASDAEQEGWGDTRLFPPSFSLSSS